MRWYPIAELDQFPDDELVLPINSKLIFASWCVRALREDLEREPTMPRHLQFGFTHFLIQRELLAACPLPTES